MAEVNGLLYHRIQTAKVIDWVFVSIYIYGIWNEKIYLTNSQAEIDMRESIIILIPNGMYVSNNSHNHSMVKIPILHDNHNKSRLEAPFRTESG